MVRHTNLIDFAYANLTLLFSVFIFYCTGSNVDIKIIEGPQNITVPVEMEAELHCFVEGFPIPTVQWFKDGRPLPDSSRWDLQKDGQVLIFQ